MDRLFIFTVSHCYPSCLSLPDRLQSLIRIGLLQKWNFRRRLKCHQSNRIGLPFLVGDVFDFYLAEMFQPSILSTSFIKTRPVPESEDIRLVGKRSCADVPKRTALVAVLLLTVGLVLLFVGIFQLLEGGPSPWVLTLIGVLLLIPGTYQVFHFVDAFTMHLQYFRHTSSIKRGWDVQDFLCMHSLFQVDSSK